MITSSENKYKDRTPLETVEIIHNFFTDYLGLEIERERDIESESGTLVSDIAIACKVASLFAEPKDFEYSLIPADFAILSGSRQCQAASVQAHPQAPDCFL